MAKVKIAGNAAIITSTLKVEEIEKIRKYTKSGLTLKDETGKNDIFTICLGDASSLSKRGICYASQDNEGYALATLPIPEYLVGNERKTYITDNFAMELANLANLETCISGTLLNLQDIINDVEENIEVVE